MNKNQLFGKNPKSEEQCKAAGTLRYERRETHQPDAIPLLKPQAGDQQIKGEDVERGLEKAFSRFLFLRAESLKDGEYRQQP